MPVSDEDLAAAAAEAARPRTCPECYRLYGSAAAFQVHRDRGQCIPGDTAYGQLVLIDGVLVLSWSDAARS